MIALKVVGTIFKGEFTLIYEGELSLISEQN
jgi:hypothetical protein